MLRSAASKVMWVGRATVFLVGLAVILALVVGAATAALGATGGNFILGQPNSAGATTKLTSAVAGPALELVNNGTSAAATALRLSVPAGKAPMKVSSGAGKATNLDADKLDGRDSSELEPRGYAQVDHNGPAIVAGSSKGVLGVVRTTSNTYCFDLSFTPKAAVASAHLNNNATVGTLLSTASGCTAPYTDAAARVYGANDSSVHGDVSFGIVFM